MHSFYIAMLYVCEALVLNSFLMDLYICGKIIEGLLVTVLICLNVEHSMFSTVAHNTSPKIVIMLKYSIFFWGYEL